MKKVLATSITMVTATAFVAAGILFLKKRRNITL